tara:strand:- start:516 stop:686 length:171 start_codon:yes stop_codon:yes gene_type:complete
MLKAFWLTAPDFNPGIEVTPESCPEWTAENVQLPTGALFSADQSPLATLNLASEAV